MEDKYYIDDYGDLKKRKNLKDWSDWEPWSYWKEQQNWISCGEDLEEFDRIIWRDNVRKEIEDGVVWFNGVRLIIGEIRKFEPTKIGIKVFIAVIHSEGLERYEPGGRLWRPLKAILRYGAYRAPRIDEDENWGKSSSDDHLPYPTRMKNPATNRPSHQSTSEDKNMPSRRSRFVDKYTPRPR